MLQTLPSALSVAAMDPCQNEENSYYRLMSIYSAGNCGALGSVGRGSDEKTCGVLPVIAFWCGKTYCSSSYPHAGQTKPSQQKYGTVNSHAGHRVVAIVPPDHFQSVASHAALAGRAWVVSSHALDIRSLANASFAVKQKAGHEIRLSFDRHNATLAPSPHAITATSLMSQPLGGNGKQVARLTLTPSIGRNMQWNNRFLLHIGRLLWARSKLSRPDTT
jgi:hypothetical protein